MKSRFVLASIFIAALKLVAQDKQPLPIFQAVPVYPLEAKLAKLRGKVTISFVVDTTGKVRDPVVLSSTNPILNQSAIEAVLKWQFHPGVHNGVPVNTKMEVPISFQMDDAEGGADLFQLMEGTVDQSKLPPEFRYDVAPKPVNTTFAVYPFELLRDGISGSAQVRFAVNPDGGVAQAVVIKADRPEFGQALIAMLDERRFQPATKNGKPTWALMNIEQAFSESSKDVPVSEEALELISKLKKKKLDLCSQKNLDAPVQIVSQHSPAFPSALRGKEDHGRAMVEFLIDKDGKVQLPRVVSATDPAFGYAAVQGISEWKFSPPTSHGEGVMVRVRVPVSFSPPKPVQSQASTKASAPPPTGTAAPASLHGRPVYVMADFEQMPANLDGAPVYNLADLDQPPSPRFQPPPEYPYEMRKNDVTGTVVVGFICDTQGHVREARVLQSSGSSSLDQAAVAGVSRWQFTPGQKGGSAVNTGMLIPIAFGIQHGP